MVSIELITVGDELLIGQVIDTNSAWIGRTLGDIGARVDRIVSVHDSAVDIEDAVRTALRRADVVIMTGGLGPTKDDITKRTLAGVFGVELVRNQSVYEHVRRLNEERGLEFNSLNQDQALVPEGVIVLMNQVGTAPGMMFKVSEKDIIINDQGEDVSGKLLFSLPGVPFEMKELVSNEVIPLIRKRFTLDSSVVHRTLITFGMAESVMSLTIAAWEDSLPRWMKLAYLPNARGVRLRLSCYDVDILEAGREIERKFGVLENYIKPYILGYEPASIESTVGDLLIERGQTLAVAESCTGGSVSARITALSGASAYYLGGVTSYSDQAKVELLGVSARDVEQHGAVSESVAMQMAEGALRRFGSDYAISTTGVAGPSGGTAQKPVGSVWMAIAWREADGGSIQTEARLMRFSDLREQNIERSVSHALNMLRLHLLGVSQAFQQTGML